MLVYKNTHVVLSNWSSFDAVLTYFSVVLWMRIYILFAFAPSCGFFWRKYFIVGAGEAQSVYCLTTDWTTGVRSPTEAENFSSSLCVQTGSGAHPASCTLGNGGPFPEGKALPGRDFDHSPPSSAEVKNEWELAIPSLATPCASMACSGITILCFIFYSS
jgi:hypothetical protein